MHASAEQATVRLARQKDIRELAPIWQEMMDYHEQNDGRFALVEDAQARWVTLAQDMAEREDGFVLAAYLDGRAAGFVLGWLALNPPIYRRTRVGFISEIAVASWARRRGVGSLLIQHVRKWCLQRRLEELQLSTAVWNQGAHRFWAALEGTAMLTRYSLPVVSSADIP